MRVAGSPAQLNYRLEVDLALPVTNTCDVLVGALGGEFHLSIFLLVVCGG